MQPSSDRALDEGPVLEVEISMANQAVVTPSTPSPSLKSLTNSSRVFPSFGEGLYPWFFMEAKPGFNILQQISQNSGMP